MGLGNIRFITGLGRRKNPSKSNDSSKSSNSLNSKGKSIIVLGIVMAVIGFAGAIYYGSQFVKEVNGGATLPYTTPSQMKNLSPMDFEIVFVVIAIIGFGILTYEFVGRIHKPLGYYPK